MLIYVERLMERGHVPLTAGTWRPIVLCALLLASKVWQDYASWNVEFSLAYPQFPLASINRLERCFLEKLGWDLYISQQLYAKYYFGLRALTEKNDFRAKYNRIALAAGARRGGSAGGGGDLPQAKAIQARTESIKSDLTKLLSKSV